MVVNTFHNLAENRPSRHTTGMTVRLVGVGVVHQHQANIAGIFHRNHSNERSHLELTVVLTGFLVELFSRSRFAAKEYVGNLLARHILCRTIAVVHHMAKHAPNLGSRHFRNHAAHFHRLILLYHFATGIAPFLHNHRLHQLAAIGYGGIHHHHLHRRHQQGVAIAHGFQGSVITSKFVGLIKLARFFAVEIF